MQQLSCTQKEASKMLGVSIGTIGTYIKNGTIKAIKIGSRTLITIKSIHNLLGETEPINIDIKNEYYKLFSEMSNFEKLEEIKKLTEI